MKPSHFVALGLAGLALAGCRADPHIELMERELRLQEDEIYRLRDCIEDYQAALDSQRGGVVSGPSATGQGAGGVSTTPSPIDLAPLAPPVPELGEPLREGELPDLLRVPEDSQAPTFQQDQPDHVPSEPVLPGEEAPDDTPEGQQTSTAEPIVLADSRQVARLVLNRLRTGGYDADGRPGDEGIVALIEPRDAQGRPVAAPADISVVAVDPDPTLEGEAARVGRWDFTAAETAKLFRTWRNRRGIQLQMSWPGQPPAHGELQLFVRYTTSDGRQLQAKQPIEITLPGKRLAGWAPSTRPAPSEQSSQLADSRQLRPSPETRAPASPSLRTAVRPAEATSEPVAPKLERPVWSPNRQ